MVIIFLLKLSTLYVNSGTYGSLKWVSQKYGFHYGQKTKIIAYESDQWRVIKNWV